MSELSIDQILSSKKATTKTVTVLLDGPLYGKIQRVREELAQAKSRTRQFAPSLADKPEEKTAELEKELAKLEAQAKKASAEFTFKALGRATMEKLTKKHPPTEEQKKAGAAWNPDTMAPDLLSASCIKPEMTLEQATALWNHDEFNQQDLLDLFLAALEVNTERPDLPFFSGG